MKYNFIPILFIIIFSSTVDTLVNTVDTTKNVAAGAVDKSLSFLGNAKGTAKYLKAIIYWIFSYYTELFIFIVDSVASTVSSTIDTTKAVAGSVVEKGTTLVGGAKGRYIIFCLFP